MAMIIAWHKDLSIRGGTESLLLQGLGNLCENSTSHMILCLQTCVRPVRASMQPSVPLMSQSGQKKKVSRHSYRSVSKSDVVSSGFVVLTSWKRKALLLSLLDYFTLLDWIRMKCELHFLVKKLSYNMGLNPSLSVN